MIYILVVLLLPMTNNLGISNDKDAIEQTLNNYIYGRNEGDIERLRKAFHPSAELKYIDPNTTELRTWASEDYINNQEAGKSKNCTAEIKSINVFQDAAQATVVITYPNVVFYDFMSLLKVEGEWLIVDKIFARENVSRK
ncbi:nuclear transport factor 2 family protein [Portibacter marinus]|uniref:nuclear transport factor 2 family protein n=1 Tax=Portibacter marinus TaxID=2898660 RepID=UPI001F39D6A6|nr:nuclear transport factor 2 family protein [Portibacter marinus]